MKPYRTAAVRGRERADAFWARNHAEGQAAIRRSFDSDNGRTIGRFGILGAGMGERTDFGRAAMRCRAGVGVESEPEGAEP